ncbi:MAG: DUF971 domain-containing protein [Maricaulaceae bacterium]|nr:DUF971 domain-containing protein [Maricaulaceae bacterium]
MNAAARPWPVSLRFSRAEAALDIAYDDGMAFHIPFALLRAESPSAEVRGHGPVRKPSAPVRPDVRVTAAEPVGRYAVRLSFDDGHDTGIYSWDYLRELGERAAHGES